MELTATEMDQLRVFDDQMSTVGHTNNAFLYRLLRERFEAHTKTLPVAPYIEARNRRYGRGK